MSGRFASLMVAVTAASLVVTAAPSVNAMELEVGGVVGGNWNLLVQPTDPEGSYTFLWGSAFSGFGTVFGPTAKVDVLEFEDATISVSADLLYGYHRGAGFADHTEGGRIDILLTTHVVRFPVLARFGTAGDASTVTFGLGVEPIMGVTSTATVEQTGIDQSVPSVDTAPASTVAGVVALGFDWVGDEYTVPIDARLVWNPFHPSSTEERFDGFDSPQDPGDFRVGFDWQLMVTAGVRWDFDI